MRKLILVFFFIPFILIGCSNAPKEQTVNASGKTEHWSVTIDYSLTQETIRQNSKLLYSGEQSPKKATSIYSYPTGSQTIQSTAENYDLSDKEYLLGASSYKRNNVDIQTFKEAVNKTVIKVSWDENGKAMTEEIKLELN